MCKTLCKGTGAEIFSSDCVKLQNIIMLVVFSMAWKNVKYFKSSEMQLRKGKCREA